MNRELPYRTRQEAIATLKDVMYAAWNEGATSSAECAAIFAGLGVTQAELGDWPPEWMD